MRFAVIPSKGRKCLADSVKAILPQVDQVIIIDTGNAWQYLDEIDDPYSVQKFLCDVPNNISHWWNEGLLIASAINTGQDNGRPYEVAVINDDCIVPEGWFDAVASYMRTTGAKAGCSGEHDVVLRVAEAVPLSMRLQGFAFILAGEEGLRANEDLHWYFTDDYIDWESRKLGGMAMLRGYPVQHLYPNGQLTPELSELIAQDAQKFVDIYGKRPW